MSKAFKIVDVKGQKLLMIDLPVIKNPEDCELRHVEFTKKQTMQEDIDMALEIVSEERAWRLKHGMKPILNGTENKKGWKP